MKIFIGPTGIGIEKELSEFDVMPPAQQGDIASVALEGATTIILIDGYFSQHLSPWHKEIIFAIEKGCRVIGAGSLGALRAVECERYGMELAGDIARWYKDGVCIDDSDVALAHACKEDGYMNLSVPLVNILSTCISLNIDYDKIVEKCRSIFYMERSWKRLEIELGDDYLQIKKNYINQKQLDTLEAIKLAKLHKVADRELPKNLMGRHFMAMLLNDVPKNGIRPYETAKLRKEAADFFLLTEFALALGVTATKNEILTASQEMWYKSGVTSQSEAIKWLYDNNISEEQWNMFALRTAIRNTAANWLDSSSGGCDLIPLTNQYQTLTFKN